MIVATVFWTRAPPNGQSSDRTHRGHRPRALSGWSPAALVAKIAMGYRGYGLPMIEIISEGNVGLMQAVKRFDPDRGFRLATYAMWWIRAAIQEYILHSWSLVKLGTTAAQKKLFFNLRRLKSQMQAMRRAISAPRRSSRSRPRSKSPSRTSST